MLTKFLTFSWTLLFKSLYLCNNSKYAAMRTRHILLFALVLLVSFPISLISQDHSVIVEMNEKGPTTPKPRSQKGFSSSTYQNSSKIDKNAPCVWIDLDKKELCIRILHEGPDCRLIFSNDNESFYLQETIATGWVINSYQLSGMEKPGRYTITVLTPEKCYQGNLIYNPSNSTL